MRDGNPADLSDEIVAAAVFELPMRDGNWAGDVEHFDQ